MTNISIFSLKLFFVCFGGYLFIYLFIYLFNYLFLQWVRKAPPTRYTACDVGLTQSNPRPNSWLISNQIAVEEANRIDITVEYLNRKCSSFSSPSNGGRYCVNDFDLYLNQSDNAIADQAKYPNPLNNTAAYENVTRFRHSQRTLKTIQVFIKGNYFILAFHNYGGCNVLYSVKVTYNVCPEETLSDSLVSLPRTVAPVNHSESIRVQGNCNEDTVQVPGSLYVHCERNGEWNVSGLEGRCICKEDMQNVGGNCEGLLYLSLLKMFTIREMDHAVYFTQTTLLKSYKF